MSIDTTEHAHAQTPHRRSLDRARSTVEFSVRTFWGLSALSGRFDGFDGSYVTGPHGARIELTVDALSFETGSPSRDERLRTAVSLAFDDDHTLRFASTEIVDDGSGTLRVAGVVEAAGRAFSVTFPATIDERDGGIDIKYTTTIDDFAQSVAPGPLAMLQPPATLHVVARFT